MQKKGKEGEARWLTENLLKAEMETLRCQGSDALLVPTGRAV